MWRVLSSICIFLYRACLSTIYACGLRISEATHISIGDIDSAHMRQHVKDQYVPLPAGDGEAVLKYLAPYVFRVAISNKRIVKLDNGRVTFS